MECSISFSVRALLPGGGVTIDLNLSVYSIKYFGYANDKCCYLNCIQAKLCFLLFSVFAMQCRHGLKICHLLVLLYQIIFSNDKVFLYSLILTY